MTTLGQRYRDVTIEKIPLARKELLAISRDLIEAGHRGHARRIQDVVFGLMSRDTTDRPRGRTTSARITSDIVRQVHELASQFPDRGHREIGAMLGIDGGRVSEILAGHRTVESPGMSRGSAPGA